VGLEFNPSWRFVAPANAIFQNSTMPSGAIGDFFDLIGKVATQGDYQEILEHYKGQFCRATGRTHVWSSNSSWTETDLHSYMQQAAENAPLFIEAFWDACETLRNVNSSYSAPDEIVINDVLLKHKVGYVISPPNLVLRENETSPVAVPERPKTLAENAIEILQDSLGRSDQLLAERRGREAVQELLWLLETVATAFREIDTGALRIEGKYFNQIVKELRGLEGGRALDQIMTWMTALHGYLSSPTGGGVRHGLDVKKGIAISQNEAKLFCNLIRSYLVFLLNEHERLSQSGGATSPFGP
jgi:hypothetical protein